MTRADKRESAPKNKVQSITDAKFPVDSSEVEMLKGIVSNELKTKRRVQENVGDEVGRREGERETLPKHQALTW